MYIYNMVLHNYDNDCREIEMLLLVLPLPGSDIETLEVNII